MPTEKIRSDFILLLAAIIWGFAFVAQRAGMEYVGPFTFSGIRFALGFLVLIPVIAWRKQKGIDRKLAPIRENKKIFLLQFLLGLLLFGGVSFQQYGLLFTTAGNAGFITGFYVVLIPVAGLFLGHRNHFSIWIGVILALAGLYFISVTSHFSINKGDYYVFICAIIWTFHVLLVGYLAPRTDPVRTSLVQFGICSVLSLLVAVGWETVTPDTLMGAVWTLLYGGVLSVGIAFTLQVVAQQNAHPAYAAIILSLESVFAVLGGWLLLQEQLTPKMILGCVLMFGGMIAAQLNVNESK